MLSAAYCVLVLKVPFSKEKSLAIIIILFVITKAWSQSFENSFDIFAYESIWNENPEEGGLNA